MIGFHFELFNCEKECSHCKLKKKIFCTCDLITGTFEIHCTRLFYEILKQKY